MTEVIVRITDCDYTETVQLTTEDIMRKLIAAPIVAGLIGMAALAAPRPQPAPGDHAAHTALRG